MFISQLLGAVAGHWYLLIIFSLAICAIRAKYWHGLNKYPGPFWASVSDLWQVIAAVRGYQKHPYIQLHQKYGDIVRIAPNKLSFADPVAIRDVLGVRKNFPKSGFYFVNAPTVRGHPTPSLFSSVDKEYHDRIKGAVNNAFSVTSLVHYEPYVDRVIAIFMEQMKGRFADSLDGSYFNLSRWLHYYSLDVIGEIVYGQQYGFLKTGKDVDNMIRDTQESMTYSYWVGQAPWIDRTLKKNPITMWLARRGWTGESTSPAVISAMKSQSARLEQDFKGSEKADDAHEDLLDQFIRAKKVHPEYISDKEILMLGISMVLAGADTTAWTLSAFFYYVLRTPGVYTKLVAELLSKAPKDAGHDGSSIPYTEAQKLPYLDACIKETFRMHPAGRFSSERVVPPEGSTICGQEIPGGTVVAVNAWVIHRRKEIWGNDVDVFRPERWLEDIENSKKMAAMLFQFGAGNFICLGRNISLLEMYKFTAAAMMMFEWELADPEQEWRLADGTFARPEYVNVRIRTRRMGN